MLQGWPLGAERGSGEGRGEGKKGGREGERKSPNARALVLPSAGYQAGVAAMVKAREREGQRDRDLNSRSFFRQDIKQAWRQWKKQDRWYKLEEAVKNNSSPICLQVGTN